MCAICHPGIDRILGTVELETPCNIEVSDEDSAPNAPTVHVRLLQSVHLPPHQSTFARVKVQDAPGITNPILLECDKSTEEAAGLLIP